LWSVKANQGTLYQETEQIYLAGDVVIEQPATADSKKAASQEDNLQTGTQKKRLQETGGPRNASQAGLRIETDRLHIDPNLQIAQTTDPVVISRQDARVNAIGMKANLQTNSVELLAKVKGIYVPPPEQSR
jgi:LPS export ABC transporter protein LptC